jgi:hypothetical protein
MVMDGRGMGGRADGEVLIDREMERSVDRETCRKTERQRDRHIYADKHKTYTQTIIHTKLKRTRPY